MYETIKKIFEFSGDKKKCLKRSLISAFFCGIFASLQFGALYVILDGLISNNKDSKIIWMSFGIMLISVVGRIMTTYFSTMDQTETGYDMVAQKRIHIGDRLRYIPMGYFNKNNIGNITAIVTTILGDVENTAARVLVTVVGGFFNSVALMITISIFNIKIGLLSAVGIICFLVITEISQSQSVKLSSKRQSSQEYLVE